MRLIGSIIIDHSFYTFAYIDLISLVHNTRYIKKFSALDNFISTNVFFYHHQYRLLSNTRQKNVNPGITIWI